MEPVDSPKWQLMMAQGMMMKRAYACTAVHGGNAYVMGGKNESDQSCSTVELIDLNTWAPPRGPFHSRPPPASLPRK
jgi:hypothetical protein